MSQFFAANLGPASARLDNIFVDWARLVDGATAKPERAWAAPEAFLCILLAAALCDASIKGEERELVAMLAHRSRGLRSLSANQLAALQQRVTDGLAYDFSAMLEAALSALPEEYRLPAFAHALDIALADDDLSDREARFLDNLVARFELDPVEVKRIAEVIVLKNQC